MKAKNLTLIQIIIVLIGIIIQTYLISNFYTKVTELTGYSFAQYSDRLITAAVTYIITIISFGLITYYTTLSIRIIGEERKRNSLIYLRNFYLFLLTSIIVLSLGLIYLALNPESKTPLYFFGAIIYPYPMSLGIATILGFAGILNLLLFGVNEYIKEVNTKIAIVTTIMLIVGVLFSIWPNNFYGVYSLKDVPDIRPLTNLVLLGYYLTSLVLVAPKLYLRSRTTTGIIAFRFKMIALGYVAGLGFFFFYFLDTVYGGGLPYTFWMFPAWIMLVFASIMFYLGILTPRWIESKFVK